MKLLAAIIDTYQRNIINHDTENSFSQLVQE